MLREACLTAQQHYDSGNRSGGLEILKELACKFPDEPMPYYMLAMWLLEDGQDHLAIPVLHYTISLAPENPEMWSNLGGMFKKQEHRERAIACYQTALKIDQNFAPALKGMAGTFVNQGNPGPGLEYAKRALAIEGEHKIAARNDLALLLLESGDWENGFREYRSRADLPMYHVREYGVPRWDGGTVKTLAVHAEQGIGDEILFASCLPDVRAGQIVAECSPRLLTLFQRSFPHIRWYGSHDELMASEKPDAWERMGDLPGRFRKKPSDCPGTPFLRADPAKVVGYRARLESMGNGPYIGFAWLGGTSGTHRLDRRAPRDHWGRLIERTPGTKVSLQYGEDGSRHAQQFGLHHWQSMIDDLDECAALIMALDVVVSSPQTVIHISGALGKRCIIPLSSKPAWRYQVSGPMPWYRSVELVRQKGDDWSPVFESIGDEVGALCNAKAA